MSGIWIRNQSKEMLVNCNFFNVCYGGNCYTIETYFNHNVRSYGILGKYSTKEKALKVLDKIQRHIEKLFTNTTDGNTNYHMFKQVFEMPQDNEV